MMTVPMAVLFIGMISECSARYGSLGLVYYFTIYLPQCQLLATAFLWEPMGVFSADPNLRDSPAITLEVQLEKSKGHLLLLNGI